MNSNGCCILGCIACSCEPSGYIAFHHCFSEYILCILFVLYFGRMDTADVFRGGIIEAMSTVISSLGNVGPGLGAFGPAFSWAALPDAAKWILSFLMLIGRLELFAVLLLFYSGFWERR